MTQQAPNAARTLFACFLSVQQFSKGQLQIPRQSDKLNVGHKAMEFTCDGLNTLLTRKLTTLMDRIWEITRRE